MRSKKFWGVQTVLMLTGLIGWVDLWKWTAQIYAQPTDTKLWSELLFNRKDAETQRHGDTGIEKNEKEWKITSLNASRYETDNYSENRPIIAQATISPSSEEGKPRTPDGAGSNVIYQGIPASPGEGKPSGNRDGAGSQSGECKVGEQQTPLIALMPSEATVDGQDVAVWGRTTEEFPTLWFYSAYPTNSDVIFELQDEEENTVYSTNFQLQGSGIVSVTIPPTEEFAFKAGEKYLWYFYVICDQSNSPDDFVRGWVEVVEPTNTLARQLEQAETPLEQAQLYAENGFWLPTLAILDRLRVPLIDSQSSSPNIIIDGIWSDLLQQIGLEEINQVPVVQRERLQVEED